MSFWKKVDEELEYLGKSRKELAFEIGFNVTNISFGIKRNSVTYADTALKIARYLGVSLDCLLDMEKPSENFVINPQIQKIENKLRRFSKTDLKVVYSVVNALDEKYK